MAKPQLPELIGHKTETKPKLIPIGAGILVVAASIAQLIHQNSQPCTQLKFIAQADGTVYSKLTPHSQDCRPQAIISDEELALTIPKPIATQAIPSHSYCTTGPLPDANFYLILEENPDGSFQINRTPEKPNINPGDAKIYLSIQDSHFPLVHRCTVPSLASYPEQQVTQNIAH